MQHPVATMSFNITSIDPSRFREALGHYASGITVITSLVDGELIGFTCQSFYSVSMSPPLVSFSVMACSVSYPKIRKAGRFAVNILSNRQAWISNQFAQRGSDKWKGIERRESPLGNPIITDSLKWLDCKIHAEHAAGDHIIVIGEVKALNPEDAVARQPLLYFKGQYHNLADHSMA
ncbi:flavin reductase family protein [uncultured Nitrosomonas sp.]|uniref:flavin reductase family protein n=1 Tax=uncultured Nitrosomonas sp. TaxID=156424 RepID=UPI0026161120|nr:flavin reductase family protein [uncultured Nitrosomonas sp.]